MKICSMCGKELPLDNFSWKNKSKGIYQSRCKSCQSKVDRQYYLKSQQRREAIRARARQDNQNSKNFIREYKETHPCCICGEKRWYLLDFHHIDNNKEKEVSQISTWGIPRIIKEIEKCAIMCANCHREYHWQEANNGITFQQFLTQNK